ncbi:ROK family protein [Salirhabdus sp. Marseille-P4669]|uniref:ROK family protein n=1 Tax=Salirhabdus sp. Marseille-P4669 TaxID=2042310 RepID=UPI000C7BC093|nr:ROK family protein [Salirhabdus sp. Marseille-P4669]
MLFGAIEAGGTKFVCAIGNEDGEVHEKVVIDTISPEVTMPKVMEFFQGKNIQALGVGCFGPIDVNKESPTYGYITSTPKIKWQQYNFVGELEEKLHVPIAFDSDVNVAALGEKLLGAGRDVNSCMYITVGTGIGAGYYVNGKTLSGISHPEMGHTLVLPHPKDQQFEGNCPFHGPNCLEGMAAGPAIEKRWGMKGVDLPQDHVAWELEAYYLAQALMNFVMVVSPEKIVMGGGVMKQKQLFPFIYDALEELLAGYLDFPQLKKGNMKDYIVPPELGDEAGVKGALMSAVMLGG